jgi:hypothetical protein
VKTERISNDRDEHVDLKATIVMDRRGFDRVPPQFELVGIRTKSGDTIAARAENVSLGGIGLRLESSVGIAAGDEVDVVYLYAALPAVVRYIEPQTDDTAIAGLEWTTPPKA